MNFHCLGQLFYGDSSSLLLTQEQNNLKENHFPTNTSGQPKMLPGNVIQKFLR